MKISPLSAAVPPKRLRLQYPWMEPAHLLGGLSYIKRSNITKHHTREVIQLGYDAVALPCGWDPSAEGEKKHGYLLHQDPPLTSQPQCTLLSCSYLPAP
jgi:hypothetical protein